MTASDLFSQGIALARSVFAQLDQRGSKWKNRNVPIYIREQLWRPYYFTEQNGKLELYIIRPPDEHNEKVHFTRWEPPSE